MRIINSTVVIPKRFHHYETYEKGFEWRNEAEEFVKKIDKQSKEQDLKVKTKILPSYAFKSWGSTGKTETKIIDHYVRWYFMPRCSTWFERFFAPSI